MDQIRQSIVAAGRAMVKERLTAGTGGNISAFCLEQQRIAITPSGLPYEDITVDDIVLLHPDGAVAEGRWAPSSEWPFHVAIYQARPDVQAVVHTHSVYATTFACLGRSIPAVHYLVGFCGHSIPVAPYASFGTVDLARQFLPFLAAHQAVLLGNHGLVTVGDSLDKAMTIAIQVEFVAQVYYQCCCIGDPTQIPRDEMARVMEKLKHYGIRKGSGPADATG